MTTPEEDPFTVLADIELEDVSEDEERDPVIKQITGYDLYLLRKYGV